MSYGCMVPSVSLPFFFACGECSVVSSVLVEIGKDACFEESCREATRRMEAEYGWTWHKAAGWWLCPGCKEYA